MSHPRRPSLEAAIEGGQWLQSQQNRTVKIFLHRESFQGPAPSTPSTLRYPAAARALREEEEEAGSEEEGGKLSQSLSPFLLVTVTRIWPPNLQPEAGRAGKQRNPLMRFPMMMTKRRQTLSSLVPQEGDGEPMQMMQNLLQIRKTLLRIRSVQVKSQLSQRRVTGAEAKKL